MKGASEMRKSSRNEAMDCFHRRKIPAKMVGEQWRKENGNSLFFWAYTEKEGSGILLTCLIAMGATLVGMALIHTLQGDPQPPDLLFGLLGTALAGTSIAINRGFLNGEFISHLEAVFEGFGATENAEYFPRNLIEWESETRRQLFSFAAECGACALLRNDEGLDAKFGFVGTEDLVGELFERKAWLSVRFLKSSQAFGFEKEKNGQWYIEHLPANLAAQGMASMERTLREWISELKAIKREQALLEDQQGELRAAPDAASGS